MSGIEGKVVVVTGASSGVVFGTFAVSQGVTYR